MESEQNPAAVGKAEAARKHHRDHQEAEAGNAPNPTHRAGNPTHGQKHLTVVERIAVARRATTARNVGAKRKDHERISSTDRFGLHRENGMR